MTNVFNARAEAILSQSAVTNAMNAFMNIDGVDYYPQIYIPYFDEMTARRSQGRMATDQNPVIVLYLGDESQEVYPGYQLNTNNEFISTGQMIDEEYALNNEVWVISLNETYFGDSDDSNMGQRLSAGESAKITRIKVKCHKESWTAGASEVNIITVLSEFNFTDLKIKRYGGDTYQGGQLKKVERSDIGDWKGLDFSVIANWDVNEPLSFDHANFVIFEYDSWPTGLKDVTFAHSAQQAFTLEFRSADNEYSSHIVTRSEWPQILSPAFSNNCIVWESGWE